MTDEKIKMLTTTIQKLYKRGAKQNIQKILVKTHTADVAELLESFKVDDCYAIFKMEPSVEKRSQILSYLSQDKQQELLRALSRNEVIQLLAIMDSDDVADMLGDLPDEESQEILDSMVKEDSEEVADLMGYPEDSAGGLMGSDFLALKQELTVQDTIKAIQSEENEGAVTFYIYVINDHDQLVGVVSLKELLLSKPSTKLKEIMSTSVISVTIDTDQEKVAKTVERYDFLSLPVVDDSNKLMGVITVDDIIDVIREEAEEDMLAMGQAGWGVDATTLEHFLARLPWLILGFLGGGICFAIIFVYGLLEQGLNSLYWMLIAYVPLMLSVSSVAGGQSATLLVGAIRMGKYDKGNPFKYLKNEVALSFYFSIVLSLMVLLLGEWLVPGFKWNLILPFMMLIQIVISMFLGTFIPVLLHRMNADITIAAIPLCTVLSNISAIAVIFSIYHAM